MPDKKTCFIIMPITTPEELIPRFKNDKNHFLHVLENLFVPAIEKADFKSIKPIAKGSDLIHAEIIKNLNVADLVLCDMSILNPNVFFEYGIRISGRNRGDKVIISSNSWSKSNYFSSSID